MQRLGFGSLALEFIPRRLALELKASRFEM